MTIVCYCVSVLMEVDSWFLYSVTGVFGHCWGRNGEFCIAIGPVYQDCLHTCLSRLKTLAVNLSRPCCRHGLCGFIPCQLKIPKMGRAPSLSSSTPISYLSSVHCQPLGLLNPLNDTCCALSHGG